MLMTACKIKMKNRGNPITPQGARSVASGLRLPAGFYFLI